MVRIKALFVLLGVTALGAFTIGRYSAPAYHAPIATAPHAHPAAVKANVSKVRKTKPPVSNDR